MAHIRNQGWPFRMTFEDFVNKYKILICPLTKNIKTHGKNCELILKKLDISEYQIGKSKVSPLVTANICSQLSPPVHILLCWIDWLTGKCQLRVNTARIVKIA